MSDMLTEEKLEIIEQAQEIADEELCGDVRHTEILCWDDDDFRVAVLHGMGGVREKILYRSNGSQIYPGEKFLHIVETVNVSSESSILDMKNVSADD